jgi:hypothetical protein
MKKQCLVFIMVGTLSILSAQSLVAENNVYIFFPSGLNITGASSYTALSQDSFLSIAERFYGSANKIFFPLIAAANNIGNFDLKPGARLLIPKLDANLDNAYSRRTLAAIMRSASVYYQDYKEHALSAMLASAAAQLESEPGQIVHGQSAPAAAATAQTQSPKLSDEQRRPFFIKPARVGNTDTNAQQDIAPASVPVPVPEGEGEGADLPQPVERSAQQSAEQSAAEPAPQPVKPTPVQRSRFAAPPWWGAPQAQQQ